MKLIETGWLSYSAECIPITAPKVQRVESRRAFYAGAQTLLAGLLASMSSDEEPTEEDYAAMQGVQAELDQFYEDMKAGRA